ncbi:MAG: glycosyltransferase family 4 protein, partial [Blastocatellia bacterium]
METSQARRAIYFVWNYTNWGGAQIYFLAIMKLAREDWDILVLVPRGSSPDLIGFIERVGVRCEFLDIALKMGPAVTFREKLSRQITRLRSEREILNRLSVVDMKNNVFHIETAPWQSWLFLSLLAIRQANVFVTLHNFLPEASGLRKAIWKARLYIVSHLPGFRVFASNQDTKDRFKGWFTDAFWETIKVTYTSVDPKQIEDASDGKIDRDSERERFGIPPDKFVVLTVGQFIDRKGRWVLLDAAKRMRAELSDVLFVWLMPNLPNPYEQKRIDEYGLKGSFLPVLSEDVGGDRIDVLRFFRLADAFALPSLVEGLPIALLEAMALGLPSISTNVYAIPEAIKNLETGILIEAGDSETLAKAIFELKADSSLREKLSKNGSAYVLANFDERVAA